MERSMLETVSVILLTSLVFGIECQLIPYIVGGSSASIARFPYSAFLSITCEMNDETDYSCICGSSIVNELIILTAAHCLHKCGVSSYIAVNAGSEGKVNGFGTTVNSYVVHNDYEPITNRNDIALAKLKHRLVFNSKISRVALMRKPPYTENARVAGWGVINEQRQILPDRLMEIDQLVQDKDDCVQLFGHMLPGTFCASSKKSSSFASQGDSGSALVVRGYIQIGLVSYKNPRKSRNVVIYTDIGYFYNWIKDSAQIIYCG